MAQGRVQVGDLQSDIRLRPAPIQSDTYAPPPRPEVNPNTARLADALGAFSQTLGGLVGVVGKTSKEERERQDAIFQKKIAGQTLDEVRDDIKAGRMDVTQDKFANAARQSVYGSKWAQSEATRMDELLNTEFDWDSGDPEAFLAKHFQKAIEESGLSDPNAISAASRTFDQYKASVLNRQQQYRINRTNQSTSDTAFTVMSDSASKWIDQGVDPDEVAKRLVKARTEIGPKGSLGASEEMLDREMMNTAEKLASTNPEYAVAILMSKRKLRNGQEVSFMDTPELRDAGARALHVAQQAIGKREQEAALDKQTSEDVEAFKSGDLSKIEDYHYTDYKGEEKVRTAKDRKDEAERLFLAQSPSEAKLNRETPEQTYRREFNVFRSSGEKHPRLEAMVKGVADKVSPEAIADPNQRERLLDSAKQYEWLKGESKNAAIAYTTDKDRDFYETYWMAKKYLKHSGTGYHYNDEEALQFAYKATSKVSTEGTPPLDYKAVDNYINSVGTKDRSILSWTATVSPNNWSQARNRVVSLANRMVDAGAEPEQALDMAFNAVRETSTTYRGQLLDFQGLDVPDNFPKVMDAFIGQYAKENAGFLQAEGIDPSEITIEADASDGGKFRLVEADGTPILDNNGHYRTFKLSDVTAIAKDMDAHDKKLRNRDIAIRSSAKSNGIVFSTVPGQDDVWVDQKSGEIVEPLFPDDATTPTWKKTGKRQKQLMPNNLGGANR